ncbi:unnamed protein product [Phytomonas sp. EM1]|nr:unnamed protein product [Phytomonas sp. EM1]|eukprot:CCW64001.1 unnamed protein product [Phytomonas sp. isolate EM1]
MKDEGSSSGAGPQPSERLCRMNQTNNEGSEGCSRGQPLSYPSALHVHLPSSSLLAVTQTSCGQHPRQHQTETSMQCDLVTRDFIDLFEDSEMNINLKHINNDATQPLCCHDRFSDIQKVHQGKDIQTFAFGDPRHPMGQPRDAISKPTLLPSVSCPPSSSLHSATQEKRTSAGRRGFTRGCVVWMPTELTRESSSRDPPSRALNGFRSNPLSVDAISPPAGGGVRSRISPARTGQGGKEGRIPFTARVPLAAVYLLYWPRRFPKEPSARFPSSQPAMMRFYGLYEPVVLRHIHPAIPTKEPGPPLRPNLEPFTLSSDGMGRPRFSERVLHAADPVCEAAFVPLHGSGIASDPADDSNEEAGFEGGAALPTALAEDPPEEGSDEEGAGGPPLDAAPNRTSRESHGGELRPSTTGAHLFTSLSCLLKRQHGFSEAVQRTLQGALCRHVDEILRRGLEPRQGTQRKRGRELLKGYEEEQERGEEEALGGGHRRTRLHGADLLHPELSTLNTNSINVSLHHEKNDLVSDDGWAESPPFWVAAFAHTTPIHGSVLRYATDRIHKHWRASPITVEARLAQGRSSTRSCGPFHREIASKTSGNDEKGDGREHGEVCIRWPAWVPPHSQSCRILAALSLAALVLVDDIAAALRDAKGLVEKAHLSRPLERLRLMMDAFLGFTEAVFGKPTQRRLLNRILDRLPFRMEDATVLQRYADGFLGWSPPSREVVRACVYHHPPKSGARDGSASSEEDVQPRQEGSRSKYYGFEQNSLRTRVQNPSSQATERVKSTAMGVEQTKPGGISKDPALFVEGGVEGPSPASPMAAASPGGLEASGGLFLCYPSILDVVHYMALEYMTSPPITTGGEFVESGLRAVGDALQQFLSEVDPSAMLEYFNTVERTELPHLSPSTSNDDNRVGYHLRYRLECCVESYTRDFFPWRHWLTRRFRREGGAAGASSPTAREATALWPLRMNTATPRKGSSTEEIWGDRGGGFTSALRRSLQPNDSPSSWEVAPPQLAVRAAYTYVKMLKWILSRPGTMDEDPSVSLPPHILGRRARYHEANDLAFLLCVLPRLFRFHAMPQEVRCVFACALGDFSSLATRHHAFAGLPINADAQCGEGEEEDEEEKSKEKGGGEDLARDIRGAALRYFLGVICCCAVRCPLGCSPQGELEKAFVEWLVPFFAAHWRAWWWTPQEAVATLGSPGRGALLEAAGASIADVAVFYGRRTLRLLRLIRQEMRRRAIASVQRGGEDKREVASSYSGGRPPYRPREASETAAQELDERSTQRQKFAKVELDSATSRVYSMEPSLPRWGAKEAVSDVFLSESGCGDATTVASVRPGNDDGADGDHSDATWQRGVKSRPTEDHLFWLKGPPPSFAFFSSNARVHRSEVVGMRDVIERMLRYFSPTPPSSEKDHVTGHGSDAVCRSEIVNGMTNNSSHNTFHDTNARELLLSASLSCLHRALPWALEGYLRDTGSDEDDDDMEVRKDLDTALSSDTDARPPCPWLDVSSRSTQEESAPVAGKPHIPNDDGNANTPETATPWSSVSLSTTAEVESSM